MFSQDVPVFRRLLVMGQKPVAFSVVVAVTLLLVPSRRQAPAPESVFAEADRLAQQGNWNTAGPLYAQAERQFKLAGDRTNEIDARLGRLHRDAESGAYRTVREQIAVLLREPLLEANPALRIRALSVLGTVDLNLDTDAAERDWSELLRLADQVKDPKWQNRAEETRPHRWHKR